ncbi:MAG TPA: hypothetical protein VLJ60_02875, partial [bacterium]|nr:hypothetical protein [bacterium]
ADKMDFCDAGSDYLSCSDLIMVRFKTKVKSGTPKHSILENTASIDSAGLTSYKTNLGMPVKLRLETSGCVSNADDVNLDDCGGEGVPSCETTEECGEGKICDEKEKVCIDDPSIKPCKDSNITVSIGKNSPVSDIIFIAPQENLVIGQIEVVNASGEECYFNLASLKLRIDLSENNIALKNIKLVADLNGDGIVDSSDRLLSSTEALKDNYADFASSDPTNRLWGNVKNNLLFVLDAGYKEGEQITRNSTFTPSIEKDGIKITDSGKPSVAGLPLDFSKFQFEPDDAFIVTKGPNDPAVPAKNEMNKTLDILQFKVVSKGSEDKIKSLVVKIPKTTMAQFGSAIKDLSIYEDTNNDGKGDTKLITASSTDSNLLHDFKIEIPVAADTPKYFTIRASLNLKDGDSFQVQVSKVTIDSDKDKLGLPVNSKEYSYTCDAVYEDCGGGDDGCSISSISTDSLTMTEIMTAVALFISAFAIFFRKSFGK